MLRADNLSGRNRFPAKTMHPDSESGCREQREALQRANVAVGR